MVENTADREEELRWVASAQAGDLIAFDRLAKRYRPAARLIAQAILRSPERAEDAVQDALVAAYKSLPNLDDGSQFAAWLGAIVRNRSRRLVMGEARRELALDRLVLSHSPSIAEDVELGVSQEALRCAIHSLPEETRDCVLLYYVHEWPVGRIAAFFSIPNTTVKWRLHAARRRLRKTLDPEHL